LEIMKAFCVKENIREERKSFFSDWCYFMALIYLKAGDAKGAIDAYDKVREHITLDRKERILCKVKGVCSEAVYQEFERGISK